MHQLRTQPKLNIITPADSGYEYWNSRSANVRLKGRKIDPVVHFEMPAEDRKRMAKFYTSAFGWQTQMLGEDMGNYVLATTAAEVDKKGRPKKVGIINGGFYTKNSDMPARYPSVVIAVDDIKKSMN